MAARKQNGNHKVEEALAALTQSQTALTQSQAALAQSQAAATQSHAVLAQNQAVLLQNQALFVKSEIEANERFRRIEDDLDQIKAILLRHEKVLQALPEAIREKVGFKKG